MSSVSSDQTVTERHQPEPISDRRLLLLRVVAVATVVLAVNYVGWRWLASVNWAAWWIAVPLVLAETYSLVDVSLFALTMWRARARPRPGIPPRDATVDVFIATYNEPIDLVMRTATAAKAMRWPHETYVLDDGSRPEMRVAAAELGVGYIARGDAWSGFDRHAKAGNINNALEQTTGEFILILDADMIPRPQMIDEILGYFNERRMAIVQTPQIFSNVATGDPLGSQAPLFYGPIQEGKDGWNAAFFCGSNAMLRREALMQLGVTGYVREVERTMRGTLRDAAGIVRRSRRRARDAGVREALAATAAAIQQAQRELRGREPLAEITYRLQRSVDAASAGLVSADLGSIRADLAEIAALDPGEVVDLAGVDGDEVVAMLARRDLSPLNALEAVQLAIRRIDVDRADEAQAIMPLATISVTEDMATSMRLHALGWKTAFHNELLADGLAPEDLGTMLTQRLRWAQGTMQVFLRENPLFLKGMRLTQRLMYFSTMWSYLAGFAAIVYFAAPAIFLGLGVLPVRSYAPVFFWHFLPFFIVNQILFLVAARGLPTWRGQQYSLALFPVWLKACTTAFNNVVLRLPLDFAVTPKVKTAPSGVQLGKVKWQITVAAVLLVAAVIGIIRMVVFGAQPLATVINLIWIAYDYATLSVLIGALRYKGYQPEEAA
ncbi:glycosyltransferase [Curtobacterium ammoniigenes]|uniref:glycosyltransferase n=1 Tax=Curtobacterium ammoniigenes TaxID=395387 RepID=UPI0009F91CF5|nr:glycosyltransferase [Curtobacterium ammoniigenes]